VVETFGRIDILVNNAATNPAIGPIVGTDEKIYDHIMETNLKGYFMMSKFVGAIMVKQKSGNIINISSAGVSVLRKDWVLTASVKPGSTC